MCQRGVTPEMKVSAYRIAGRDDPCRAGLGCIYLVGITLNRAACLLGDVVSEREELLLVFMCFVLSERHLRECAFQQGDVSKESRPARILPDL